MGITDMNKTVGEFFRLQLSVWEECRSRYEALSRNLHREIEVDGRQMLLLHNPERKRSVCARVDGGKVQRPCFLCHDARPDEQMQMDLVVPHTGHQYELLVNPYPIVDGHLTIVAREHIRQTFSGRASDMAYFSQILSDYLVFFNGACAGASAPDHLHFQAVPKEQVPMFAWDFDQVLNVGEVSDTPPVITDSDLCNVMCWAVEDGVRWCVVRRTRHRPWQYDADEGQRCMISPASLEFCGLIPLVRYEDYDRMTPVLLKDIFAQLTTREPLLRVGVTEGAQIAFVANGCYCTTHYEAEDRMRIVVRKEEASVREYGCADYWLHAETFTLKNVTIGKQFHWEQQEDQVFGGWLHIIAREGQLHAINVVSVEAYLKSVISSEMSANNNLELLKTHAIMSRSWVLRQIELKKESSSDAPILYNVRAKEEAIYDGVPEADRIVFWYDHADHTLYDVCADDHCQRYQGLTRVVSPLVAQAIETTRGEVLLDRDGNICDARFSKCCGGRSETFDVCWQDQSYHYLQPVDDPYCHTEDEQVLRLVLNDYDQKTHDFYRWKVEYSQTELSELMERKMQFGIGRIEHLVPLQRGVSGRIWLLKVVGSQRTVVIGKELVIRKALSESHLYSSAFDVEECCDASGEKHFVLYGKGWGHGVGLCQIGAACMSVQGFWYQDILQHYFRGVRIVQIYQ